MVKFYDTYIDVNGHKHHTVITYNYSTGLTFSARDLM